MEWWGEAPERPEDYREGVWVPPLFRSRYRLARRAGPGTSHDLGSDVARLGDRFHPACIHEDPDTPAMANLGPGSAPESASQI